MKPVKMKDQMNRADRCPDGDNILVEKGNAFARRASISIEMGWHEQRIARRAFTLPVPCIPYGEKKNGSVHVFSIDILPLTGNRSLTTNRCPVRDNILVEKGKVRPIPVPAGRNVETTYGVPDGTPDNEVRTFFYQHSVPNGTKRDVEHHTYPNTLTVVEDPVSGENPKRVYHQELNIKNQESYHL